VKLSQLVPFTIGLLFGYIGEYYGLTSWIKTRDLVASLVVLVVVYIVVVVVKRT
jgi:hypothetical protein